MITKEVIVSLKVRVTIDETKFDADFMAEFRSTHYDFGTIDDHIKHLAQLWARGVIFENNSFVEGYGNTRDMGIHFRDVHVDMEIVK